MAVDEIIDGLYGLPLEEFTQARNEAASELRQAGRRAEAEQVKALRKPSAAAAALNRLVREHRREVEEFIGAAAVLRDAQVGGKGDLAAATRKERDALERLVRAAGEAVRQTLLAAAVDDDAARELLEGRLVRELEPRGFGTLLAHAEPDATRPVPAKRASRAAKPNDRAARAKLRDAETAVSAAESEERDAHRRWAQTQRNLEQAQAAVERARRELERLQRR